MSNEIFLQKYIDTLIEEVTELNKSKMISKAQLAYEAVVHEAKDNLIKELNDKIEELNKMISDKDINACDIDNKMNELNNQLEDAHSKVNDKQAKINVLSEQIVNLKTNVLDLEKTITDQASAIKELMIELAPFKNTSNTANEEVSVFANNKSKNRVKAGKPSV